MAQHCGLAAVGGDCRRVRPKKGTKPYIEGKLQTTSWQDRQSEEKKYRTEIVARDLVLLGSRENGHNAAAQAVGQGSDTEPAPAVVDDNIPF
jgi:single-strand DNA-binding protein